MKIFISCDMEGVAGIVDWSQCQPAGGAAYERGCALMLAEVNAAIVGARAAGATDVLVNDSHGGMFNLDPAAIRSPARYLAGRHKPDYMMQGLDGTFDGIFFVGYHGSISGPASVLSHTYNPEVVSGVRLNGEYVGESGLNALAALGHGVPIALVSGDAVSLAEAERFGPDAATVTTKTSVTRFAADNVHPEVARERITEAARTAVSRLAAGSVAQPRIDLPVTVEVECQTADMAMVASWVKGVERSADRTVSITGTDPLVVFRSFVALTYITRQAGGR